MGGSHTHGGSVSHRAHRRAHAVMLAILAPMLAVTAVGVVLLWPDGTGDVEASQLPGFAGIERTETGVVRAATADVCAGAAEDRLPDGTIPDTALCATATVEVLTGEDEGTVVDVPVPPQVYRAGLAEGTRITLAAFPSADLPLEESAALSPDGDEIYAWVDFERGRVLGFLAIAFAVLVVAVGRLRGLAALGGLGLTYGTIALFVLPALREGTNAVAVALCSAVLIMTVVLYLAHGFSARTTAALLGTVLGLFAAAGLATWATRVAHINGLTDEESFTLSALTGQVDLSGIILCGIIIAGLGVLNDVTITQVSAVWEVHEHAPELGFGDLFRSGMRIGRDHLASTVYTIAFAYAGAALPTLILIDIYNQPLAQVLTSGTIAEEIVRTVVGSIGLVLAIPVTTAIAAAAVASPRRRRGRRARRPGEDDQWQPGSTDGPPSTAEQRLPTW